MIIARFAQYFGFIGNLIQKRSKFRLRLLFLLVVPFFLAAMPAHAAITATCTATPASVYTGQAVTWKVTATEYRWHSINTCDSRKSVQPGWIGSCPFSFFSQPSGSWGGACDNSDYNDNWSGTHNCQVNVPSNYGCDMRGDEYNTWSCYPYPDAVLSYSWTGTDGLSGTATSIGKTYTTTGTKTATVTVTDAGQTITASCHVSVTAPPKPDLTAGSISAGAITAGITTSFSAPVSNSGNASSGSFPTRFQITNSSGSAIANPVSANTSLSVNASKTVSASYTFASAGTYKVRACANQNASGTNITTESNYGNNCGAWKTITVYPVLAASCTVSPTSITKGGSATWTTSPSGGTGSYTYKWSGTDSLSSTAKSVSKAYSSVGTKTAQVTVTSGSQSKTVSCSKSLAVNYPTLSGSCSVSPSTITTGGSATWTAAPSGGTGTYTYSWSGTDSLSSTAKSVKKAYSGAGTKTASVKITSGTQSKTITCSNSLKVNYPTLSGSCSVSPASIYGGSSATWTAAPSGGTGSYTYKWSGTDSLTGTGKTATKTYTALGTKTASVTITSGSAGSKTVSCTNSLAVTQAPYADLTAGSVTPTSGTAGTAITFTAAATNLGTATSGSFPILFQIEGGALFDSSYVSGIASKASRSGSAKYTFASAGTYKVRACANYNTSWVAITPELNYGNNCGAYTTVKIAAAYVPPPTCSLSASPTDRVPSTLSWSSTGATSCTGAGFSTGNKTSGTASATVGGNYLLSCSNKGGKCTDSVALQDACTNLKGALTASPARVVPGSTTSITYEASGVAKSCTLTGSNGDSWSFTTNSCNVPSGSKTTSAITTQTTYTLTCDGTKVATTLVNVIPKFGAF